MKTVRCTITSKNQITIPIQYVRQMNLHKHRQLQISQRGNNLVLTPLPSLDEALRPVWQKTAPLISRPLSDDELRDSLRDIASKQ